MINATLYIPVHWQIVMKSVKNKMQQEHELIFRHAVIIMKQEPMKTVFKEGPNEHAKEEE